MKFIKTLMIFVFVILGVSTLYAEIYTWIDENGVKRFSDSPPEDAQNPKVVFPEYQHDEAADKKRLETDQQELDKLNKTMEAEDAQDQAETQEKNAQAEKDRQPTQEELIAAEKKRLESRIAFLEEQPLSYFGSQNNKRVRIGYYRYQLQALLEDPEKYFKQPASFEGNVKETPNEPAVSESGADQN
jgi:chromosome segregation ATPase